MVRHDALVGRAERSRHVWPRSQRSPRTTLPHLLVSALRLCAAATSEPGGRAGFDAGILRTIPFAKIFPTGSRMSDVTQILERVEHGDGKAAGELLPLVYEEL